jgi:hypothetical protein
MKEKHRKNIQIYLNKSPISFNYKLCLQNLDSHDEKDGQMFDLIKIKGYT